MDFAILTGEQSSQQIAGLPPLPSVPGRNTSAPKDKELDCMAYGDEYIAQHGVNNRPGEEDARGYIISPGAQDKQAWAQYDLGTYKSKRPVLVSICVGNAIAPGANEDLPLIYWVGVSDYTSGDWQMVGPFTRSATFVINSDQWRHRCVGQSNNMYVLVLTDSTGIDPTENNPDGITAVEIQTLTVRAAVAYKFTAPIIPYDLVLNYDETQGTVDLAWAHLTDTSSVQNEAETYTVERVLVSDGSAVEIGTIAAPDTTFTDPLDAGIDTPALVAGETYQYYIKAANEIETPLVLIGEVTILE